MAPTYIIIVLIALANSQIDVPWPINVAGVLLALFLGNPKKDEKENG